MTTYTLTGQITDFGDVAATNVTGTVEAGGLVDGSWMPLSRYVGPDYLTHVGATEVKVAADRSLVRSDTGGPIVLEASNDLFSYRLTLRIARGRAHVYYFTLSRDLDVRELDLAVPDPALDAVAPPHDLYIPASGTTPQPVAGAVTWDTSMRDVQAEISLTADTTITLTGDRLGAMVYIIPTLNTHILTVGDFIVSDRAAFHRELGGWVMLAGGSVITPDVTPPTAGTLAGSAITSDGFTLTVTGAADETALAALPYRFSTDNGTTWSAWRSTPYVATGLAASTAYTCQHQTRDAAGNTSTGTSITVTTGAGAATWQLWDEWNFAAKADGTLVTSIAGTNGHTLTSTSSGGTAATVQGGKIKCNATDGNISYSVDGWSTSIPHRLSIDYDVTDAPGGHTPSLGHYTLGGSYGLTTSYVRGGTTPLSFGPTYADGGSVPAVVWDNGKSATDIPTSGTMTTTIDPVARTIAVSYNGVQYAHRDLSTWTYGGGSALPMAFNGCWFRLFDLAPAASKFKVEVFQ